MHPHIYSYAYLAAVFLWGGGGGGRRASKGRAAFLSVARPIWRLVRSLLDLYLLFSQNTGATQTRIVTAFMGCIHDQFSRSLLGVLFKLASKKSVVNHGAPPHNYD